MHELCKQKTKAETVVAGQRYGGGTSGQWHDNTHKNFMGYIGANNGFILT
jgi:hypothetical protein